MIDLVQKAYVGEVFGEAMFAEMARLTQDPDRRGYQDLQRLEATTGGVLRELATRLGLSVEPQTATAAAGRTKGAELVGLPDAALLEQFDEAVETAMQDFFQMYDLAPARERPAVSQVLAHEVAIRSYVHARMAGAPDPSLAVRVLLMCWS